MIWRGLLLGVLVSSSLAVDAKETPELPHCGEIPIYQIRRHGIFDSARNDHTWLHHWADRLHITTQAITINRALNSFSLCEHHADDLYELERYLRQQPYLRDAKVHPQNDHKGQPVIEVQTWDTWSLLPTINFSRSGGENAAAFGFRDSNFLGLGIDTKALYFNDRERSGYQFDLSTPLLFKHNIEFDLKLIDSSDGQQMHLGLQRPFLNKHSQRAWGGFYRERQYIGDVQQADTEVNRFRHDELSGQLWYGWSAGRQAQSVWRYQVGINYRHDQFSALPETQQLPAERKRTNVWFRTQFYQDNFRKRRNLFLINQVEDINLGWDLSLALGWDLQTQGPTAQLKMNYGLELNPNLVWLHHAIIETERREQADHYWFGRWSQQWFYHYREPLRFYAKLDVAGSEAQYRDQPLTLGAESNLRGYPRQYQHGDWHWLGSLEARYYPNINVMQIAELGAALFYDVGRSYGDSPYPNNPSGTLQSVGVGLRFYFSRTGSSNVAHFDFVRPLSDDPQVNHWEWRAQVKNHF